MRNQVDTEAIAAALREELSAQFETVRRVIAQQGLDSTGDEALFVWVLLDDAVKDRDLSWKSIRPLVDAGRDLALGHSDGAWPYERLCNRQKSVIWRQR